MTPNILLVVLDAVRRDALEPYGAPPSSTPSIAQLASRGTAVPKAYAPASWTLPSHASMFTGLLPRRLGLTQAPAGNPQSARPVLEAVSDRLLPNVLNQHGYTTHGWSTNLWVSQFAGFDIGFDSFSYVPSGRVERMNALLASGRRARMGWALEGLRSGGDDGAGEIADQMSATIDAWSGSPTFWFVNLCECHSPYLPPRPWNDLPPRERVRSALEAQRYLSFEAICLYVAGHHRIPDAAMQRMRHLYARAAAYMDEWLARILGALDQRGILDDTVVIVTSDHGENFGEGGLIAHGFSLDERLTHVPLVLAGPGVTAIDQLFSLAELPRLVTSLAGIEDHPWKERELPEGVALAQYDPIGHADHPRVKEAARRWGLSDEGVDRMTASFSSATDGRHKLLIRNEQEMLFDLNADPGELHPLEPASANGSLAALRAALSHPAAAVDTDSIGTESSGPEPAPDELAAIEQQMKLLGYM